MIGAMAAWVDGRRDYERIATLKPMTTDCSAVYA
jgi:hypothetical protein